jgi:hypothetical protein
MGDQEKGKELMEPQNSETKLTALVVDDDKLVRMIHQGLLKRAGVKNEAVKNGKEAVDIHYSGQRFDIILMDKEMPVMTGIEVHNFKALFFLIQFLHINLVLYTFFLKHCFVYYEKKDDIKMYAACAFIFSYSMFIYFFSFSFLHVFYVGNQETAINGHS